MTRSRTPLRAPAVAPPPSRPLGTSGLRTTLQVPASAPGRCPTRLAVGPSRPASPSGSPRVPMAHWALLPGQRGRLLPAALIWIWEGVGRVLCKPREASPLPATDSEAGGVGVHLTDSAGHPRAPPRLPLSLLTAQSPLIPSSCMLTSPASPGHVQGSHRSAPEPRRPPHRGHSARAVPG